MSIFLQYWVRVRVRVSFLQIITVQHVNAYTPVRAMCQLAKSIKEGHFRPMRFQNP